MQKLNAERDSNHADTDVQTSSHEEAIHTYEFRSLEMLKSTMRKEAERASAAGNFADITISFNGVPPSIIDSLISERRTPFYRISLFDKEEQEIIITIPKGFHETTIHFATAMFDRALERVHMLHTLQKRRSSLAPYDEGNNRGIEPDECYQLKPRYREDQPLERWPQVVIEVTSSESDAILRRNVARWFERSNMAVRLVLTVKVSKGKVRLAAWTITAKAALSFRGEIAADRVGNEFRLQPESRDIDISFRALFFRDPVPEHGESNLKLLCSDMIQLKDLLDRGVTGCYDGSPTVKSEIDSPPSDDKLNQKTDTIADLMKSS